MKKLLIFFAVSLFLFGCGKNDSSLVLTWSVGKDDTGIHSKLISMFEETHPKIKVRLIEMPSSSNVQHDSYVTYLAAKDPTIDLYTLDVIWTPEFASAKWIQNLDAKFLDRESFLDGPVQSCIYKDAVYAVPWFTDAGLLYYRKDLFEAANLPLPKNWKEFVNTALKLQKKNKINGFVFQGQQYEGLVCNFLEWIWANGGEVIDSKGNVVIDSPAAVEALQFMTDLIHKYQLTPSGVVTYKEEESRQFFTEGKSVFLRNWPYVWALSQNSGGGSKIAGKVGVLPLPSNRGKSFSALGGWNLAVSQYSRHPEEAWQFVQFLIGEEAQKVFALQSGKLPTRKSLYHDKEILSFAPHYKEFYPIFTNARPRPQSPFYAKISDVIQIAAHKSLTLELSPSDSLKQCAEKIKTIIHSQ